MKNKFQNLFYLFSIVLISYIGMASAIEALDKQSDIWITGPGTRSGRLGINVDPTTSTVYELHNKNGDFYSYKIASSDTGFIKILNNAVEVGVDGNGPVTNTHTYTDSSIVVAADDFMDVNTRANLCISTVASAGNLVMGDCSYASITGTTTINGISTTNFEDGAIIVLRFAGSLTVTDSASVTAPYQEINLSTGSNFSATANDRLTLQLLTSEWWEVARTVNAD